MDIVHPISFAFTEDNLFTQPSLFFCYPQLVYLESRRPVQ